MLCIKPVYDNNNKKIMKIKNQLGVLGFAPHILTSNHNGAFG